MPSVAEIARRFGGAYLQKFQATMPVEQRGVCMYRGYRDGKLSAGHRG